MCGWGVTVSDRKRTHYDNLQVSRDASRAVIQAAYRALAQRYHPDKWPEGREEAVRIMRIINEAYEVLSDPEKRRQHDRWIDETFGADVEGNDSAKPQAGGLEVSSPPKTVRDTKAPLRAKPMWLVLAAVLLLIGAILLALPYDLQLNRVGHDGQPPTAPLAGQPDTTPQQGLRAANQPDETPQQGLPAANGHDGRPPTAPLAGQPDDVGLYKEDPTDPAGKRFPGHAIKAEQSPTKIPTGDALASKQVAAAAVVDSFLLTPATFAPPQYLLASVARQPDYDRPSDKGGERLVTREEQPADVKTVTTRPVTPSVVGGAAAPTSVLPPLPGQSPQTNVVASTEPKKVKTMVIRLDQPVAPSLGGYVVQVGSQRTEADAQATYRTLQSKYPSVLGNRRVIIKRADLGKKGVYYRAHVGPFSSAEEAGAMCSSLKEAGGQCVVQRN